MRARDNPFGIERLEGIRFRAAGRSFEQLMAELEQMAYRAAVVGADGSGKTTLLGQIAEYLSGRGLGARSIFTSLDEPFSRQQRRAFLAELGAGEIVLLDGADHLSGLAWRAFKKSVLRKAGGLIITSHKPGLMPTLLECETTENLLAELVEELLAGKEGMDGIDLPGIYNRHNGNIRDCLRHLYDVWGGQSEGGNSEGHKG